MHVHKDTSPQSQQWGSLHNVGVNLACSQLPARILRRAAIGSSRAVSRSKRTCHICAWRHCWWLSRSVLRKAAFRHPHRNFRNTIAVLRHTCRPRAKKVQNFHRIVGKTGTLAETTNQEGYTQKNSVTLKTLSFRAARKWCWNEAKHTWQDKNHEQELCPYLPIDYWSLFDYL